MNSARIYELETAITGAAIIYGYPAIKKAEKDRKLEMSARHKGIWNDLRELATEDMEAKNIPFLLVERGYAIKEVMGFQDVACNLDAVEQYANILHKEAARREAIRKKLQEIEALKAGAEVGLPDSTPQVFTALSIINSEFPEPAWVIPGVIPAGLTILAGKPKLGKSWLALNLALAVANGGRALGKIAVSESAVLFLALEDTPRRIKSRLKQLSGFSAEKLVNLHFAFDWPRGVDGAAALSEYLTKNPAVRLVVVDTLQKIRDPQTSNGNVYSIDSEALSLLKRVADERDVALLVIHHTRKAGSDDPLEEVSGSFGVTGSADTVTVLKRCRGEADGTLFVTGRDVDEQQLALQRDDRIGWSLLGDAVEYARSKEQKAILDIFRETDGPLKTKEVAEALGKKSGTVRTALSRMVDSGLLERIKEGTYTLRNTCNAVTLEHQTRVNTEVESVTDKKRKCNTSQEPLHPLHPVTDESVILNNNNKLGKYKNVTLLHENIYDLDFT